MKTRNCQTLMRVFRELVALVAAATMVFLVPATRRAAPQPPARQAPVADPIPNRPNPEARYLIFATHGWRSNAAVWPAAMTAAMGNTIPPAERFQWHRVAYDWAASANTWLPNGSVGAARAIGAQLAAQIVAPFPGGYDRVHVLGHSAGTHLVDAMLARIIHDERLSVQGAR